MAVVVTVLCGMVTYILASVQSLPLDPCVFTTTNNPKRWGETCEFLCNCNKNSQCSSDGVCLQGCAYGWSRDHDMSPCSIRLDTNGSFPVNDLLPEANNKTGDNNKTNSWFSSPNDQFFSFDPAQVSRSDDAGLDADNRDLFYGENGEHHRRLDDGDLIGFSYTNEMVCEEKQNSIIVLSWEPDIRTVVLVEFLYARYHTHFAINLEDAKLHGTFSLQEGEKTDIIMTTTNRDMDAPIDVFVKKFKPPVLLDNLKLHLTVTKIRSCEGIHGAGIVSLYGVPVCPFRRWGLTCQSPCRCPCKMADCHPLTGNCVKQLKFCPDGRYGQHCEKKCSASCIKLTQTTRAHSFEDYVPEGRTSCHVISGYCRECPDVGYTGPECSMRRKTSELNDMLEVCERAPKITEYRSHTGALIMRAGYEASEASDSGNIWRGKMALVVVAVSLLTFLLGFALYVTCVRYIARKKLRAYMARLDRQRILRTSIRSWSELREEFKQFGEFRGRSTLSSTDNDNFSDLGNSTESAVDPNKLNKRVGRISDNPSAKKVCFR